MELIYYFFANGREDNQFTYDCSESEAIEKVVLKEIVEVGRTPEDILEELLLGLSRFDLECVFEDLLDTPTLEISPTKDNIPYLVNKVLGSASFDKKTKHKKLVQSISWTYDLCELFFDKYNEEVYEIYFDEALKEFHEIIDNSPYGWY